MTSRPAMQDDLGARRVTGEQDQTGPPGLLRVGDDERSAGAVRLADAYAAGRLSPAEHDSRLSRALTAVTAADLAELLHDLPVPLRSPDVVRHRSREPVLVTAAWVALFQLVLMLGAFCVGVDLERESRSACRSSWPSGAPAPSVRRPAT